METGNIPQTLSLAMAHHQAGDLQEADQLYTQILKQDPEHLETLYQLGCVQQELGQLMLAKASFEKVLKKLPHFPDVHLQLGWLAQQEREFEKAIACYQQATQLDPQFFEAFNNLGNILRLQGKLMDALTAYRQALQVNPHYPEALYNLAQVLESQGNIAEAAEGYQKALQAKPDLVEAHVRLGMLFAQQHQLNEAIGHFTTALQHDPHFEEAHFQLANTYKTLDKLDEAIAHYQEATRLQPNYADAYNAMGLTYEKMNRAEDAVTAYEKSIAARPSTGWRMTMMTVLPAIYHSKADIAAWRNRFAQNVRQLLAEQIRVNVVSRPNFYLVYHGENDRDLQQDYAQLFRHLSVPYTDHAPHAKPRIGFISSYFRKGHTIGRLNRGLIQHISREKFDVRVFTVGDDYLSPGEESIHPDDCYIRLPLSDLVTACKRVAEEELDLLLYADIGMEPLTYFMALSRLAKVQCVTWGHPVTTGMETMDYFLSSRDFEVPQAQEHYSETLVCLNELYPYFQRPTLKNPKTRADFGLPNDANLYICLQSLFKYHPDFDEVLAGILRQDPKGRLVLLHHTYKPFNQVLLERWQQIMPDVMDRIQFVDRVNRQDFINLMALADVLLDPLHFGGGNTTLEALAFGVPVVTLPSEFLRCRLSYGFYRKMNLMDCVAETPEAYISIAVRLGADPAYREALRNKILANNGCLFENMAAVRELEDFFQWALKNADSAQNTDNPLPNLWKAGGGC